MVKIRKYAQEMAGSLSGLRGRVPEGVHESAEPERSPSRIAHQERLIDVLERHLASKRCEFSGRKTIAEDDQSRWGRRSAAAFFCLRA
jgi:hypothetical protein